METPKQASVVFLPLLTQSPLLGVEWKITPQAPEFADYHCTNRRPRAVLFSLQGADKARRAVSSTFWETRGRYRAHPLLDRLASTFQTNELRSSAHRYIATSASKIPFSDISRALDNLQISRTLNEFGPVTQIQTQRGSFSPSSTPRLQNIPPTKGKDSGGEVLHARTGVFIPVLLRAGSVIMLMFVVKGFSLFIL